MMTIISIEEDYNFLVYLLSFADAETDDPYFFNYVKEYYDVDELLEYNWPEQYREFDQDQFGRFLEDPYLIVFFFFFLHFLYRFFGTWEILGVNYWIRFARFDLMIFLIFGYINLVTLLIWNENFFTSPIMVYILMRYYWKYTCFFDPYYHYQEMEIIEWELIFSNIDTYYYSARRVMLIVYPFTAVLYALWYSL